MIQTDVGQDRHFRGLNGVGGVVLAAQANFQGNDIALMPLEVDKSNTGNQFKLRGLALHGIGFFLDLGADLNELLV